MFEAYALKHGKVVKIPPAQVTKVRGSLVWVRCISPTEKEIEFLSKVTSAPEEEFRETIEEEERPKLVTANYLEIIFSAPIEVRDEFTTTPLYFYVNKNIVLTIEKKIINSLEKLAYHLRQNSRKFLFKSSISHFIYYVMDTVHDEYLHLIEQFSHKVDIFEEKGLFTRKHMDIIYDASVSLAYFNQALLANIEVLNALRKCDFRGMTDHDRRYFEELYHDALQLRDTEAVQREVITNLFDLQSLINTNRLNRLMKRLASFALIIMVPTLISGMYGMNFKYLPFKEHPYGYAIVWSVMLLITMVVAGFFLLSDWL